ncbi:multidrug efflux SMR transporter [Permianibacter sp. IMCC34836]|uniref:DMT family transporter n=1 Tax=Permianibacter fluminis TaxID=2738515 RepID=UPI001556CA6D|nr:multidrug efflux SMR transporter [Permianibacter fluminis]NQD39110.1 multidrug efflux SMR transporter [Permianibacter fluminis]
MAWFWLVVAGVLEIAWASALPATQGFSKFWPSVFVLVVGTLSVIVLGWAVKSLPVGTAYAVWTGIGTLGTVIIGMLWLNEPRDAARLFFIAMIVAGCVGLKLVTKDVA